MSDLTKSDIISFLKNNKSKLQSKYLINEIGLFGSFSTNKNTISSDIDILVEFKAGGEKFKNYMSLKFYLEDTFSKKVDLVIKKTIKPRIRDKILAETLYA